MPYAPEDATPATAQVNRDAALYELADRQDFGDAAWGLIAPWPGQVASSTDGHVIFDPDWFGFIGDEVPAPDTVNPSLWRQSQVMRRGGLYRVTDGVYQARNNDMANLTIIEGPGGLVVIDCTTGIESARQGMALFREHVSDKPVAAVIYTHTHIDHYGGVKGVVDPADVASGKVPVIAPGTVASFDKYAIGENVVAGSAMSRRAFYAFGGLLDIDPRGAVGCGIGIISARAPVISYISPTDPVTATGTKRELAGLEFEFLYAPDTEAPEEMHIWIPQLKALTCAENANHTLHNIHTLRGARTRDARNFARYLDETLQRWGDAAEVHHNLRAVYAKELGLWDGDPVSLHPHPPAESAKRFVALAGADAILQEGRRAIAEADYRWAAEILHKLVFAQPDNQAARELQADAYEQMGYQAEGPQWRGIFLTAAKELRAGVQAAPFTTVSPDTIMGMPVDILFDFAAVHVIGDKAAGADLRIDFAFTDLGQTWTMWVRRGVLNARLGSSPDTQLTVSGPKAVLVGVILQPAAAGQLAQAGKIQLDGDQSVLAAYAGLLDEFDSTSTSSRPSAPLAGYRS
jgi:alkyl sulfatase BDS1-like metallo-beta-lactamase superfamily hydrolase